MDGGTKSAKPFLYFILEIAFGIFPQIYPLLSGTVLADESKSCAGSIQTVSSPDNHRPQLQPEPVPLFTSTDIA